MWYGSSHPFERPTFSPKIIASDVIAIVKAHFWIDVPILLTKDGRLLICLYLQNKFVDVTNLIRMNLSEEADIIPELYAGQISIMARTGNRASIIMPGFSGFGSYPSMELVQGSNQTVALEFDSIINMASFNYGHGFFRTEDNKLYSVNVLAYTSHASFQTDDEGQYVDGTLEFRQAGPRLNYGGFEKKLVPFDNPQDIKEIISGKYFTLFLMNDGYVYVQRYTYKSGQGFKNDACTSGNIMDVIFLKDECITKIITDGTQIFYLTIEGACYYQDIAYPQDSEWPVLIEALAGYRVDNAFILKSSIVFKYDDKLCTLNMLRLNRGRMILHPSYKDATLKPEPLPFFDGVPIASVTEISDQYYFLTIDGSLYTQTTYESFYLPDESGPIKIAFFDANPVATEKGKGVMSIRSALSVLNQSQ